jgi:4-hydroxy 2-oxovalerate aldolase
MRDITIIDSTLRDGSHAIFHQLTKKNIEDYCKGAERAKIPVVMVGHGNGLGASSLQLGYSLLTDHEMLISARKYLKNTKLGAFLIPGFGTIKKDLEPAISDGVEVMMVACHCTEANVTREHIEYLVKRKIETYGVLMMTHMATAQMLLEQARLMESYGASGILLMDSAGAYLPSDVIEKVGLLTSNLKTDIGFHSHNNLGMAVANAIAAVSAGAAIIDGTTRGLGAGAGNCQLEVFIAVCQKIGVNTDVDLYKLMDVSDQVVTKIMRFPQEISSVSLVSGLAGVFSGFAPHAKRNAKKFNVDVRNVLMELGKRKVVAGQEDIIIDVAYSLKKQKRKTTADPMEALL